MGSFDCYCALCCGPLGIFSIKLGSKKASDLRKRRERVERKRRRLVGEDGVCEEEREGMEGGEDGGGDVEMSDKGSAGDDGGGGVGVGGDDDGAWDEDEEDEEDVDAVEIDEDGSNDGTDDGWEDEQSDHGSASGGHSEDAKDNSDDFDSDGGYSDKWSQASELSLPESFTTRHSNDDDDGDSMYSYNEQHSYDSAILARKDVQWLDRCRTLGLNRALAGKKRAFISGRGRYDDVFDFRISKHGNDPRDPGTGAHPVYHCYEPEDTIATFPFHEECFKLLTRCMGYSTRKDVDKDVLYNVMSRNVQDVANNLDLAYGDFNGAEQFWESIAGEEWCVVDPGPKAGIEHVVKNMLPASLFTPTGKLALHDQLLHKVKHDALTVLPYDILHNIFGNLSLTDTLALVNASLHVLEATRESAFWRQMIRLHVVPYFYELDGMLRHTKFPDTFDWKAAFQWLDKITKPRFGMKGPLMGVANRRRIWAVCQDVAALYYEKINAEA